MAGWTAATEGKRAQGIGQARREERSAARALGAPVPAARQASGWHLSLVTAWGPRPHPQL